MMYEKIKRLYLSERLSDTGLDRALERGWISASEAAQLVKLKERKEDNANPF